MATPLTAATELVAAGSNPPGPFGLSVTVSVDEVSTLPSESSILTTVVGTADPALAVPGCVVKTRLAGEPAVIGNELLVPEVRPVAVAVIV